MNDTNSQHILSYALLLRVWAALLALTVVTVGISRIDLGALNIWAALAIACSKGTLVLLFFMHLKYESRLFAWMFLAALCTLCIFIGFTFLDVLYR